jgi:hypothetical protein
VNIRHLLFTCSWLRHYYQYRYPVVYRHTFPPYFGSETEFESLAIQVKTSYKILFPVLPSQSTRIETGAQWLRPWTIRHWKKLDAASLGWFVPWMIRPWDDASLGWCAPGTFCPWPFCEYMPPFFGTDHPSLSGRNVLGMHLHNPRDASSQGASSRAA